MVVHTFLWVVAGHCLRVGIIESLTSYPGEISHSNSADRELSIDVSVMELRRREVALHTSSHQFTPVHTLRQLKRDEGLFPPLSISLAD